MGPGRWNSLEFYSGQTNRQALLYIEIDQTNFEMRASTRLLMLKECTGKLILFQLIYVFLYIVY